MNAGPTSELSHGGNPLRVFISSPFCEPAEEPWSLREQLRRRLKALGHKPWLYEIDAKRYKRSGLTPAEIIVDALRCSDLVITVYRNRAGSFLVDEPFFATAFETIQARRLGKPVYLHVLGSSHKPRLRSVLSVFEGNHLLPDCAKRHGSEHELIEGVLSDVTAYATNAPFEEPSIVLPSNPFDLVNDWDWLGTMHTRLLNTSIKQDLWQARRAASAVPILAKTSGMPRDKKFTYATLLSACAGVLANQAEYARVAERAWLAVRLFMELGCVFEMVAQIQATSGILDVGNHVKRAYWVNTFGFQSASRLRAEQFRFLGPAFNVASAARADYWWEGDFSTPIGDDHFPTGRSYKRFGHVVRVRSNPNAVGEDDPVLIIIRFN